MRAEAGGPLTEVAISSLRGAIASSWCDRSSPTFFAGWNRTRLRHAWYSELWREMLPHLPQAVSHAVAASDLGRGDIYAFGVAQGVSLRMLARAFQGSRVFGFDSWAGLPEEDHRSSKMANWVEGSFKPKASMSALQRRVPEATLIPGFYNQSLKERLVTEHALRVARYVDIDCDLHASTSQALAWLFEQNGRPPRPASLCRAWEESS